MGVDHPSCDHLLKFLGPGWLVLRGVPYVPGLN